MQLNFDVYKQLVTDYYIDHKKYTRYFSDKHIEEIDKIASNLDYYYKLKIEILRKELETLSELFDEIYSCLVDGQGVYLLQGFPVKRYTIDKIKLIYQILGKLLGKVLPQNIKKEVITDIINLKKDDIANIRGYLTDIELEFHTDACDFVALLCLDKASIGGISKVASSSLIYEIASGIAPDIVKVGFSELPIKNVENSDLNRPFSFPVYKLFEDKIYSRLVPGYTKSFLNNCTDDKEQKLQLDLLNLIQMIADSPGCHFSMELEPGDIQFLNNNKTYHSRTKFSNSKEHTRHLLRLWLRNEGHSVYPEIFT